MRTALRSLLSVALLGLGISGSFADEGMWLLNAPPAARMKAAHGWAPDEAWLAHAQRSAVRFNTGGSGSLVSGRGLVMTNHHVGRDMLAKLSTPERDFNATGFYAPTLDQELPCPDLELNILWSIEDVTDRVNAGVAPGAEVAAANQQRQATIAEICRAAGEKSGLQPEMVTLWQGGRYHLYLYKRYTDVRIVFAPEEAVAFFGGDTDNFEYPRYCLDVMFFRIYENGKPLANDSYFTWERGSNEGDLALVVGHPGSTSRQLTIDHLASLRDAEVPARLARYWRSEVRSTEFVNRSKEHRRVGADDLFGVANARKAVSGAYLGLLDPAIMGRKAADERALREAVDGNPEWKARFADGWDKVAAAAKARRDLLPLTQALRIRSGLLGRAVTLVQLAEERTKPDGERLARYHESQMPAVELELLSPAPISALYERFLVEDWLVRMVELLGADHELVRLALGGKRPNERAAELVNGSGLADPAYRKDLFSGGGWIVAKSSDPMIALAKALDPHLRRLQRQIEDTVDGPEADGYSKIASARFAVHGEQGYPDATFTLRLAYGPIRGYEQDGRTVPAYTDFAGLYTRAAERAGQEFFDLPKRWTDRKPQLDLSTPFNFVCTADIIGGNSGSPVLNKAGEVIGLIFDGNIQSLVWDYAYSDAQGRAVCVDARAIIHALRAVYEAKPLVDEILAARETNK